MRKLFLLGMIASLFVSCEESDPLNTKELDYFPLEVGNYWIYQHFNIDASGSELATSVTDSILVSGDTIINGQRYSILEGTNHPFNGGKWGVIDILRDSMGYIVTQTGRIRFSGENFSDILDAEVKVMNSDTLYTLSYKMEKEDALCSVPVGDFEVLNFKGTVLSPEGMTNIDYPRYLNTYYAKGVGPVLKTFFFLNSPVITEKRLVRYHVPNG
ncbi:MAG: hypothetical protein GY790_22630 [Bacteroidetes bacterium]|nr:hypothetical protein [Bacteroidota bacterium]